MSCCMLGVGGWVGGRLPWFERRWQRLKEEEEVNVREEDGG